MASTGTDTHRWVFADLLRHGETVDSGRFCGTTDVALSAAGKAQMWAALGDKPCWSAIVTSTSNRCAEFAHEYATRWKLPVYREARLREVDFGQWESCQAQDIEPGRLAAYWNDPVRNPPPGGEPLAEFRDRVVSAWQHWAQTMDGPWLLVTHGGVIRVLLAHVLEMPLHALARLEVPHASLSRLRVQRDCADTARSSLVCHGLRL
jgi:alpha-ribazole phosphatase